MHTTLKQAIECRIRRFQKHFTDISFFQKHNIRRHTARTFTFPAVIVLPLLASLLEISSTQYVWGHYIHPDSCTTMLHLSRSSYGMCGTMHLRTVIIFITYAHTSAYWYKKMKFQKL